MGLYTLGDCARTMSRRLFRLTVWVLGVGGAAGLPTLRSCKLTDVMSVAISLGFAALGQDPRILSHRSS